MKSVTIILADPLYAIASDKAGQMGVERFLEHFVAEHLYEAAPKLWKKTHQISIDQALGHSTQRFQKDGLPDTVIQIHAILKHMREHRLTFRKAVKATASEFGVRESTVRDKCTRRITISSTAPIDTAFFQQLLENPQRLVDHLCQKFPDHRQGIVAKFQPLLQMK